MSDGDKRLWYLRQVDLFSGLSDAEIDQLLEPMKMRHFRKGDLIVGPDTLPEMVYVVKEGTVRLFHRGPDGREITADMVGRGRLFGVSTMFGAPQNGLLAEAATDADVCGTDGQSFLRVISQWPQVMLKLAGQLGAQLLATEQRLELAASADARARLGAALARLARDAGEDAPGGGRRIMTAITHAALARQIGSSRETVTRLLATLEVEGHIRRDGRRLIVKDPARLAEAFKLPDG